ncbi:MAG: hypothetical protein M1828_006950 [Chrysothrix sp. TS-e1954]|nr:MAG: hypothetical protein M1828_006950 [Chrysothrix sp. TS-e1954]
MSSGRMSLEHDTEKVESLKPVPSERRVSGTSSLEHEGKEKAQNILPMSMEPPDLSREVSKDMQQLAGIRLVVVVICVMESSVVATSLLRIADAFDNFQNVNWVVQGYLLSWMGFTTIFARVSDIIGRKSAVIASWTIFGIFSLAGGLSKSLEQLIAFRVLQGVGGSGLYCMTMVVLPEVMPPSMLAATSGLIGASLGLAGILGPLIGGGITTHSEGFPKWVFLLNVPAAGVVIIALLLAWPRNVAGFPPRVSWRTMDFVGAALLLGTTVMFVFALEQGGAQVFAWDSPTIIGTLTASGFCGIALILWSWYLAKKPDMIIKPLLPARLFTHRVMCTGIVSTILVGFSMYTILIELPQRFQTVNYTSPVSAGIRLLPILGSSAFAAMIGGLASSKKNNTAWTLIAAACLMALGTGLLSSISDTGRAVPTKLYSFEVLFGFGIGLTFSTSTVIAIIESDYKTRAVAQGLVDQSRTLGGAIGLSAATILFNKRLNNLSSVLSLPELRAVRQSLSAVVTLTPEQQRAVRVVFADAFRDEMRVCLYVSCAFIVLALFAIQRNAPRMEDVRARDEANAKAEIVRNLRRSRQMEQTEKEKVEEV